MHRARTQPYALAKPKPPGKRHEGGGSGPGRRFRFFGDVANPDVIFWYIYPDVVSYAALGVALGAQGPSRE